MKYVMTLFCIVSCMLHAASQQDVSVTIVYDDDRSSARFLELVKAEVNALTSREFNVSFNEIGLNPMSSAQQAISRAMTDESNVVVSLGFKSSNVLSALNDYPKPCIAGISLQRTDQESTGINNFTYIQSPFSIEKDFEVFQSIYPFKHLAVFIQPALRIGIEPYLNYFSNGFELQFISISNDPAADLAKLEQSVDAVYFLPNLYDEISKQETLIDLVNDKKLPSFSLIGREDVERGVLASNAPSEYIEIYARRIALNVMKILEGQNPKDLPVQIGGVEDDFLINVATMEKLEIYPAFDVLSQASLIQLNSQTGKQYSLESAIAEALANNLSFRIAQKDVDVQQTEISIAKSNLLPDISAGTTLATLDGTSADLLKSGNQLTPQTSWTGNVGLTQLVYSQSAYANVAIQEALLESDKAGLMSQQLDLVLDVCISYLRYLQAQANLNIQNTNVQTTLRNLNIAKTKAKIGTVSNADVYGLESQLAINKSSLNDAQTAIQQSRISYNQLLNRPIDENFVLEDLSDTDKIILPQDLRMVEQIQNHYDIRKFAEFLTEYAFENAPELDQLDWTIRAQEHSLKANQKSLYQPQVALQGSLDKTFGRYGTRVPDESFEAIGIDPYKATWNLGVNASLPIFQGNLRRNRIQKDKILLDQLGTNKELLQQSFATNIRLSLENLGNSYNDIQFNQQAETSSRKFLDVIEDLYREGVSNIVTLLDAQNNALASQLASVSSQYQFLIDAITIERLYNNIYIVSTPEQRESFINEYFNYLTKKESND